MYCFLYRPSRATWLHRFARLRLHLGPRQGPDHLRWVQYLPSEVEGAIETLPGVAECAVIGVPHADFGQGVVAVVIQLGCRARQVQMPKRIYIADSLPHNAMGKVQEPTPGPAQGELCGRKLTAMSIVWRRPSARHFLWLQVQVRYCWPTRKSAAGPCAACARHTRIRGKSVTAAAARRWAAAAERPFAFAVLEMRLGDDSGPAMVEKLYRLNEATQVVVVTGFDSFAPVAGVLRARAVDYLP